MEDDHEHLMIRCKLCVVHLLPEELLMWHLIATLSLETVWSSSRSQMDTHLEFYQLLQVVGTMQYFDIEQILCNLESESVWCGHCREECYQGNMRKRCLVSRSQKMLQAPL